MPIHSHRCLLLATCIAVATPTAWVGAKVTFQDDVLPLIEDHCSRCHNPDKKKADLDLTTFGAVMKGGGSGKIVEPGQPDSSRLYTSITHAEEPYMPPKKPRMPDPVLKVFKDWIDGGLLETSRSKALTGSRPTIDLSVGASSAGRPDGPPPMPGELSLEPVVYTQRTTASTGLAASPWAPLIALAGQKQVLLYHTDTFELLGILPFPEGVITHLNFSRNGQLLLAGGGYPARSGFVSLWKVDTGERLLSLGKEFDTVLAADISPDQRHVAMGGPDRLVKVLAIDTGEVLFKLKKHTDWILAVAFSPDGSMLASADRTGGISVWDPGNGQELFSLSGHKASVTGLAWRDDAKILASSGEDGAISLWEMEEGKRARSWTGHAGGVLTVGFDHDGKLVSAGRDKKVRLWQGTGSKIRSFYMFGELPVRAAVTHDAKHLLATDFNGRMAVWAAKEDKVLHEFVTNPKPLDQQIRETEEELAELKKSKPGPSRVFRKATGVLERAREDLGQAKAVLDDAERIKKQREDEVVQLKQEAGRPSPSPDINRRLATARAVRNKAREAASQAANEHRVRSRAFANAEAAVRRLEPLEEPSIRKQAATEQLARLTVAKSQSALVNARHELWSHQRREKQLGAQVKRLEAERERLDRAIDDANGEARDKLKEERSQVKQDLKEIGASHRQTIKALKAARDTVEKRSAQHETVQDKHVAKLAP